MSNEWVKVGDPCNSSCSGSNSTSAGIVNVSETITACGRAVTFSGSNTVTVNLNDKKLVTEPGHLLGAVGSIVALKPGSPAGTYDLAQANVPLNIATHIGYVISATQYVLLAPGFYTFPNHGYTVGAHYTVSATVPGAFSLTVDALPSHYLQNAFHVESADCIFVNLQEAITPSNECCTTITQVAHGFSVGDIVHSNTGIWELAVADSPGAIMVTEVHDANTFKVGHVTCLTGFEGIEAGQSYVVSPDVPGAIVNVDTLSYDASNAYRPVGTGIIAGCLVVNMSPSFHYLGAYADLV